MICTTTLEAKQKLINWCSSQVGYHEGYDNSNKYGADGDWDLKLYGFEASNVAWCDVFVDYAFIHCFGYDLGTAMTYQKPAGYAACRLSAKAYKQNGQWFSEPEVGDQIFFYYGGEINHTGVVIAVSGDTITCVEGNYSDSVGRTYYNWRISSEIAGFGRPNWSLVLQNGGKPAEEVPAEQDKKEQPSTEDRHYAVLKYGDGIGAPILEVKAWQYLLLCWGFNLGRWGADGEFGDTTENATIQFQNRVGLTADGVVDEQSWKQAIYFG